MLSPGSDRGLIPNPSLSGGELCCPLSSFDLGVSRSDLFELLDESSKLSTGKTMGASKGASMSSIGTLGVVIS